MITPLSLNILRPKSVLPCIVLPTKKLSKPFICAPPPVLLFAVLATSKLEPEVMKIPTAPLPFASIFVKLLSPEVISMPELPLPSAITEFNVSQQRSMKIPSPAFLDESTLEIIALPDANSLMPVSKLRILPFAIAIDKKPMPPSVIPSRVPLR